MRKMPPGWCHDRNIKIGRTGANHAEKAGACARRMRCLCRVASLRIGRVFVMAVRVGNDGGRNLHTAVMACGRGLRASAMHQRGRECHGHDKQDRPTAAEGTLTQRQCGTHGEKMRTRTKGVKSSTNGKDSRDSKYNCRQKLRAATPPASAGAC